jgi:glycosyltransferase involved in cell wall biosynthesis
LEPDHVAIGKIARLFHLKGHADVIAAAERVVRECPQARFVFIGDGLLRADLEADVRRRGLEFHFRFVGLVPAPEIPALLGAMDLLVHASLREGLARALPQALIAGKPAVSYDVDGAREVVLPGKTGVLVAPRDIDGLAQGMIELARDAELRQRLGGQGRGLFADRFRHERMTEQIRQVYLEALQS